MSNINDTKSTTNIEKIVDNKTETLGEQQYLILVVEDERALYTAISKKLEGNGFKVITSQDAIHALELLKTNSFDAIWLDHYLLGKETGLDFVTEVKNHEDWKHIPVFLVSNTATADKVSSYIHLGVDKYYVKSNSRLEDIINDLKELLKNKSN